MRGTKTERQTRRGSRWPAVLWCSVSRSNRRGDGRGGSRCLYSARVIPLKLPRNYFGGRVKHCGFSLLGQNPSNNMQPSSAQDLPKILPTYLGGSVPPSDRLMASCPPSSNQRSASTGDCRPSSRVLSCVCLAFSRFSHLKTPNCPTQSHIPGALPTWVSLWTT